MVLNRNCPICDKRNGEKIEHICMNVRKTIVCLIPII